MVEKRRLGKTTMDLSLIGFGGFHLCEIPYDKAESLLNGYLDLGGNYIETAPSYGNGESERKIGGAVHHRRGEFFLATKAHDRDYASAKATFEQSLLNLQTDYVDLLLMHAVGTMEDLEKILSSDGAIKMAEEAKTEGKVKHIGISMHGQPDTLISALRAYDFDAVMTTINYLDVCNFPTIRGELLPLAREKGTGIILMKPLGDGYLYKSVEDAFNFAFNQDADIVVTGMNTMDMLSKDMELAENYPKWQEDEEESLMRRAIELDNYVCRQCGFCMVCPIDVPITKLFELEGLYDRQMNRGHVENAADFALQERLKHWFGTQNRATMEYAKLKINASDCNGCGACLVECPYGINIISKLKNVAYKMDTSYGKVWKNK